MVYIMFVVAVIINSQGATGTCLQSGRVTTILKIRKMRGGPRTGSEADVAAVALAKSAKLQIGNICNRTKCNCTKLGVEFRTISPPRVNPQPSNRGYATG